MKFNRSAGLTIIWLIIPALYLLGSRIYQQRGASDITPTREIPNIALPELTPTAIATPTAAPQKQTSGFDINAMIHIPAGAFPMGVYRSDSSAGSGADLQGTQIVELEEFYIDQFEVTVAEFTLYLNVVLSRMQDCQRSPCTGSERVSNAEPPGILYANTAYEVSPGAERLPVTGISWAIAQGFCRWAGKRLPTEAEWEKAARGPDGRLYPWGDDWIPEYMLGPEPMSDFAFTTPVGSHPRDVSPYGVFDMLGNVNEWVFDWYDSEVSPASAYANPTGSGTDFPHVNRGIRGHDPILGLTARSVGSGEFVGFRCAYSAGHN